MHFLQIQLIVQESTDRPNHSQRALLYFSGQRTLQLALLYVCEVWSRVCGTGLAISMHLGFNVLLKDTWTSGKGRARY